jgi:hypothetical protein
LERLNETFHEPSSVRVCSAVLQQNVA